MATPPFILARNNLDAHNFARGFLGLAKGHYRVVTSPSSISGRRNADVYLVPGWERRHDRFAMRGALKYSRLNQIEVPERKSDAQWLRDLARKKGTLGLGYNEGELELSRDEFVEIVTSEGFVADQDDPDSFVHPDRKADFLSGALRDDQPSNGDNMISEGSPVTDSLEPPGIQGSLVSSDDEAAMRIDPEPPNVQIRPFTDQEIEALDGETGTTESSEDAAPAEKPKRRRSRCKKCGQLHFKDEICMDLEE